MADQPHIYVSRLMTAVMSQVHLGHVFHMAGAPRSPKPPPRWSRSPTARLVVDDGGRIVFCGDRAEMPAGYGSATVHDHRPGFLLPGFVDTHIHFPQTYAGDSYGGGQLLEWLNLCIFPSESQVRRPGVRPAGGRRVLQPAHRGGHHRGHGVRVGVPARAGRVVHRDAATRVCGSSAAGASRPSAAETAPPLITSEEDAIRLTREEIEKWHAADTGDVDHRAAARGDRPAVLAVGDHRDPEKSWRALRLGARSRCLRAQPPQREQPARHRRGRHPPSRSTR